MLDPAKIHYRYIQNKDIQNAPVLVLIHGLKGTSQTFDGVLPSLSKNFSVLVYDQRGHGQTEELGLEYGPHSLARDLANLLDHLHMDRVHLLGHSFGAKTALAFAEIFPRRTQSLILEDMGIKAGSDPMLGKDEILKKAHEVQLSYQPSYSTKEELLNVAQKVTGDSVKYLERKVKTNPQGLFELTFKPHVSILYHYFCRKEDFVEAWMDLTQPVLFLTADPSYSAVSRSEYFSIKKMKRSGKTQFVEIAGADHSIHKTHPERFVEVVTQFLEVQSSSSTILSDWSPGYGDSLEEAGSESIIFGLGPEPKENGVRRKLF